MDRIKGQKWIIDHFIKNGMHLSSSLVGQLDYGFKYGDFVRTNQRVKSFEMLSPSWAKTGLQLKKKGEEAEEKGHLLTAAEFYHRASLAFGRAMYWIMEEEKIETRKELCQETKVSYNKLIDYFNEYTIERVLIPVKGGEDIPGILHLPKGREEVPCILYIPGMDMIKEFFPNPFNNPAYMRGLAVLSIDGPGQGESLSYGNKVTLAKYDEAGVAAIDYLVNRPEIADDKIVLMGVSMGSLWAPRIGAKDKRVKATATYLACYMQKETMFKSAQPIFRKNYMFMSGIYDDEQFHEMMEEMTIGLVAHEITCPNLLVAGEFDLLCPAEDTYRAFDLLKAPKELWMYENEDHAITSARSDLVLDIIDWLMDVLEGKIKEDHSLKKYIKMLG